MLIGYDDIKTRLLKSYDKNKLPHAILIDGKQGIGKASFAKELAKEILGCETENNSDLLLIEREEGKKAIVIDKVRKISNFVNKTSAVSQSKFIIIDSTCQLNRSSANAILKILEEPNPNNFLILISHNLNHILPTIRSRCNIIKAPTLDLEDFTQILKIHKPSISENNLNFLSKICDSSPADAINMGEDLSEFYEIFLQSLSQKLIDDRLIKKIANKNFSFVICEKIFEFFISRLMNFSLKKEEELFFKEAEVFLEISSNKNLDQISEIADKGFKNLRKVTSLNLDKKLSFINFFNLICHD